MDAPIAICAMTHPTGRVTLHPTLTTSPADIHSCHYSMRLEPVSFQQLLPLCTGNTTKKSQAIPNTFNPSYTQPFQDCHHPGFPIRFFLRFRQLLSFKLLELSPSSDEDKLGGQFSNIQYTIGLVSDCPTVTVHAGKGFQGCDWLWSSSLTSPYKFIYHDQGLL